MAEPRSPPVDAAIRVIPLAFAAADVRRFWRVSHGLHRHDPRWVAPLESDFRRVLSVANPFFAHAEIQLWVATRDGQDVGRIAGIVDEFYGQYQREGTAFFGFFESARDSSVSEALFGALFDWARARGLNRVLGPMNPTSNEECGLLVDGFEQAPAFMMPHNPAYYAGLVEAAGFAKATDLLAYRIELSESPRERLEKIRARCRARHPEVEVRPILRRTLAGDVGKIREIYNEAWQQNWSFVPMTEAEIDFLAARLKPLLVPGLVWLAEAPVEPVGFLLAVPDLSAALRPLRGRLLTPAVLGFLPYVLGWKRPAHARVVVLGVKKKFRGRGIETAMLAEALKAGARLGFRECEASWVLEENFRSRRVIEAFGGTVSKTYRLYERAL
jgi:GNAT superfamily N-acetyltransferase